MNPYNTRTGAQAQSSIGPAVRASHAFNVHVRQMAELEQVWQRLVLHLLRSEGLRAPWALGGTSAIRGEGKSTNALGVALSLAQETGDKVLVVEADFSHPTMTEDFQIVRQPCLADYLSNAATLEAAIARTTTPNLCVLPAWSVSLAQTGASPAAFSAALRHLLPDLMTQLRDKFRYILVDMAGLLEDVNTSEMARHMDGILLVVRAGVTPMEKITNAAQLLDPHMVKGVIHVGPDSAMPRWLKGLVAE